MQWNTVVLPAPFGPINAVMLPRVTSNDRSLMATMPPKRMVRCSTRSTFEPSRGIQPNPFLTMTFFREVGGDFRAFAQIYGGRARRDQAARPPDHDQHHRQ